jgi:hypothetical protein
VAKFKVGDRVRYTGAAPGYSDSALVGKVGTVIDHAKAGNVRVDWDDGEYSAGHFPTNLALLLPADPIPAAITEYHDACAEYEAAQLAVDKARARIEDARLRLKEALG